MIYSQHILGAERIFLLQSKDCTGHRAYYFLHVDKTKLPLFEKAIGGESSIDLESYGDIITSGYGEVPTPVLQAIRRRYGWQAAE